MIGIASFLFCLASFVAGPSLLVFGSRLRDRASVFFPVALALQIGFSGIAAAGLHRLLPNGGYKWGLLLSLGFLATALALRGLRSYLEKVSRESLSSRTLLVIGVLALTACLDIGIIFARNGWSEPEMVPYFRPPLHNDSVRNVVLIEALDRKAESPYFVGAPLAYQVFWHHLFGSFVFPFRPLSHYSTVAGLTAASAALFYFLLFWAFALVRPGWLARPRAMICLWVFAFAHADIWHFLVSWVLTGTAGIEADWSATRGFFSTFSTKMVALSAPQHVIWAAIAVTWLALNERSRSLRSDALFLPLAFLVSPVLSLFLFPLHALFSWVRLRFSWRFVAERLGILALAGGLYWVVLGNPAALFLRNLQGSSAGLVPLDQWIKAPLVLVGSVGMVGLWISLCLVQMGIRRDWRRWEILYVTLGAIGIAYVSTDSEVRRHLSIVLALVVPWLVAHRWRDLSERAATITAGLTLLLHGHFLFCYLAKPSVVDVSLPWRDYFALNAVLRGPLSGTSVLGAADPWGTGLEMPIVMEATTSFSLPEHAAIHSKLSPAQRQLIVHMRGSKERVPWLARQGYSTIAWGPVEERLWGKRIRERFLGAELLREGTVSLHRLRDKLADRLDGASPVDAGELLKAQGWDDEALEAFGAAVNRDPKNPRAILGMAELYLTHANPRAALYLSEKALSLSPESRVARGIQARARAALEDR